LGILLPKDILRIASLCFDFLFSAYCALIQIEPVMIDENNPPYNKPTVEALSPAARNFGREIAPLGTEVGAVTKRAGSLLVGVLGGVVSGFEISRDWLLDAVAKRLENTPQETIVPPDARIAVPAFLALTYSMGSDPIREMFANLLASDMNAAIKDQAHPAFVEFIKEMTPADARILNHISMAAETEFTIRFGSTRKFFDLRTAYSFDISGIDTADCEKSLNNLARLGLVELRSTFPLGPRSDQREAQLIAQMKSAELKMNENKVSESIGNNKPGEIFSARRGIYITRLGRSFLAVCLPPAPKS
jgi:hypothetical protein